MMNTSALLNASDNTIVPVKNSCINNKIFTERAVNFTPTATCFHSENRPGLLEVALGRSFIPAKILSMYRL